MEYKSVYNGSVKQRVHMLLEKTIHDQLLKEAEKIGIRVNGHICNILADHVLQMDLKKPE